jgi:putative transposase
MKHTQSLSHSVWDCKYHVVWIPKYRRKVLYGRIRRHLGEVIRELARQRESQVLEGHLCADHVHVYISIPPKYAVAQVVGYIKGKSAIHIARNFAGRVRNFTGENFWARGYFASTVGRDEELIRNYIRRQEQEDRRVDQMKLLN